MTNTTDTLKLLDNTLSLRVADSECTFDLVENPYLATSQPQAITAEAHRTAGLHVLVGEGATLAGLGKYFVDKFCRTCTPAPTWLATLDYIKYGAIGIELYRFATEVAFGKPLYPGLSWAIGTMLAVPALVVAGTEPRLVVDVDRFELPLRSATARIEIAIVPDSLNTFSPLDRALPVYAPLPSPLEVAADRTAVETAFASDHAAGIVCWTQRLRWNPYAAALPIIHLLANIRTTEWSAALLTTLFDGSAITPHELRRIAMTSAGWVVLRVAFAQSARLGIKPTVRQTIAAALGVTAEDDLAIRGLAMKDKEPPASASANATAARTRKLQFARSFLGRAVSMTWDTYHAWEGPSSEGSLYAGHYFTGPSNPDREALKQVGDATGKSLDDKQLADRLAAIYAIFEIEGYADAVRAQDSALISVGLQQFSFHVEDEGTVCLLRCKQRSDTWFDVFFRSAGLDVLEAPRLPTGISVDQLQKADKKGASAALVSLPRPQLLPRPPLPAPGSLKLAETAWLVDLALDGKNRWCVPGEIGTAREVAQDVTIEVGPSTIIHWEKHLLIPGCVVSFTAKKGKLPIGLQSTTDKGGRKRYFVVATALTVNSFTISETVDGPPITTREGNTGVYACTADARLAFPRVDGELTERHTDCLAVLRYVPDTYKAGPKTEDLLARWAVSARLVPEFVHAQMEYGIHRFNRLVRNWDASTLVFNGTPDEGLAIQQMLSSPALAAIAIDGAINSPAGVVASVRRAYDRVCANWAEHYGAESRNLTDPRFMENLTLAFLSERRHLTRTTAHKARAVTLSPGSPMTVTWKDGGSPKVGCPVAFTSSKTPLPANITAGVTYYIAAAGTLAIAPGATPLNLAGASVDCDAHVLADPVDFTIGTPLQVSMPNHGLPAWCPVAFFTTGALPEPLVSGRTYYVAPGAGDDSFAIASAIGGTPIEPTKEPLGSHLCRVLDRWSRRSGKTIDVTPGRVASLLDRIDEYIPVAKLGPRKLRWNGTFHW